MQVPLGRHRPRLERLEPQRVGRERPTRLPRNGRPPPPRVFAERRGRCGPHVGRDKGREESPRRGDVAAVRSVGKCRRTEGAGSPSGLAHVEEVGRQDDPEGADDASGLELDAEKLDAGAEGEENGEGGGEAFRGAVRVRDDERCGESSERLRHDDGPRPRPKVREEVLVPWDRCDVSWAREEGDVGSDSSEEGGEEGHDGELGVSNPEVDGAVLEEPGKGGFSSAPAPFWNRFIEAHSSKYTTASPWVTQATATAMRPRPGVPAECIASSVPSND